MIGSRLALNGREGALSDAPLKKVSDYRMISREEDSTLVVAFFFMLCAPQRNGMNTHFPPPGSSSTVAASAARALPHDIWRAES
jgi:hypothetical protein